jgi:hypothetical protein
VIVFSVTLSFYIQDVLNDREKIELKNISLKAILSDLDSDKKFYTNGIRRLNETIAYVDSLTNNDIITTNKMVESGAMRYFGFLGQDRNYNSMISTGSIEFINNKELAATIHLYYGLRYDLMKDAAEQDEKYYNEIVKYINSNFNVDNLKLNEYDFYDFIYSPLVLKKISADKTLRNMLLQKKWSNHWYTRTMNQSLKELNKLKQLIEIELN